MTPNGQAWPRALNTLIGGNNEDVYLVVNDLGTPSGEGLDFINGQTFLYVTAITPPSAILYTNTIVVKGTILLCFRHDEQACGSCYHTIHRCYHQLRELYKLFQYTFCQYLFSPTFFLVRCVKYEHLLEKFWLSVST